MNKSLNKKMCDLGPYIRDNRQFGKIESTDTVVVVDNVIDRDKRKIRVKNIATTNPSLYIGLSTVAVFKKRHIQ